MHDGVFEGVFLAYLRPSDKEVSFVDGNAARVHLEANNLCLL